MHRSPPSRGRGLKRSVSGRQDGRGQSPPSRGRGLKRVTEIDRGDYEEKGDRFILFTHNFVHARFPACQEQLGSFCQDIHTILSNEDTTARWYLPARTITVITSKIWPNGKTTLGVRSMPSAL